MKKERIDFIVPEKIMGEWYISKESIKQIMAKNGVTDDEFESICTYIRNAGTLIQNLNNITDDTCQSGLDDAKSQMNDAVNGLKEIANIKFSVLPSGIILNYGSEKSHLEFFFFEEQNDEIKIKGIESDNSITEFVFMEDEVLIQTDSFDFQVIFRRFIANLLE